MPACQAVSAGSHHSRSRRTTARPRHAFDRWRIFRKQMRGPDRSRTETTAAVRTATAQYVLGTERTERAFEAADHRIGRIGRQIKIAAFAVGTELEHMHSPRTDNSSNERKDRPILFESKHENRENSSLRPPGLRPHRRAVPRCEPGLGPRAASMPSLTRRFHRCGFRVRRGRTVR